MISTLDRYIGRSILTTSLLVMLTLTTLAGIFAFIGELDDVGKGSYSVGKAAQYVFLTLPGRVYLLFAPAVLLGSLLGLGTLAANSELTVMRAAGVSNARIIRAVLITGFGLMLLMGLWGEYIVPKSEQIAEELRLTALEKRLSVRGDSGLWVKSQDRYVNIATVMPDFTLLDLSIYEFEQGQMSQAIAVAKATPANDGAWLLEDLVVTQLNDNAAAVTRIDEQIWPSLISADVLQGLSISPESLSIRHLHDQVAYLKDNSLDSARVELAYWIKLTSPLATIVMLMLSLPFVFTTQRSGGAGQKIFIGILLGIGYVLLNKLLTHLGLANGFSPAFSAFLPLIVFLCIAIFGIQKIP